VTARPSDDDDRDGAIVMLCMIGFGVYGFGLGVLVGMWFF
jgi:hypothetical protein